MARRSNYRGLVVQVSVIRLEVDRFQVSFTVSKPDDNDLLTNTSQIAAVTETEAYAGGERAARTMIDASFFPNDEARLRSP